jgi:hypothetical protein
MRTPSRSRVLALAVTLLAVAGLIAAVVLTGRLDALGTLPAVIGFAVLACGRYPGETAITRLRSRRHRPRRRSVASASTPQRPILVARCIGGALRRGFGRRGPPILPA